MEDEPLPPGVADEPLPPWASKTSRTGRASGVVPSLQTLACHTLAQHLYAIESLDDLPEHLSQLIREAIRQDHRLLSDEALSTWLCAASNSGSALKLSLRWASGLTDDAMTILATKEAEWATRLLELDLAFCEQITDAGIRALAPACPALRALTLTGCTAVGDGACKAIGFHNARLEQLDLELLNDVTDVGLQAIVRGCHSLTSLNCGGCTQLTSVTTSLIADHCAPRMRLLGLGGVRTLNDLDLENLKAMHALTSLSLRSCCKVSDTGIKQIGLLAAKQMKAYGQWEEGGAAGAPPPTLTHLDLGGLDRLSDTALQKLVARSKHVKSLDLRGCSRLSGEGILTALGHPQAVLPSLETLVLTCVEGASASTVATIQDARPDLKVTR